MTMSPNPILNDRHPPHLEYSTHARFIMEERNADWDLIKAVWSLRRRSFTLMTVQETMSSASEIIALLSKKPGMRLL